MAIRPDHDDDAPIGRILTRREVLALFGSGAGAALLAACAPSLLVSPSATSGSSAAGAASPSAAASAAASASAVASVPSCIVRPELTEGPYFVDELLNRSDIRSDPSDGSVKEGLPLAITFAVSRIDGTSCTAFEGAVVDIWHCDALGVYSDVSDPGFDTSGQKWLRGYQETNANGLADFTTIWPGWYQGRAVHIHFKIRTEPGASSGLEFTSQPFFDEAVTDAVHAQEPYASKGYRTLLNEGDGIYQRSSGQTLLTASETDEGYAGTFKIGIQVS
ncbi:MAG: intradiol ring-cleavage dioxygenase [Gaiellales bacterium]